MSATHHSSQPWLGAYEPGVPAEPEYPDVAFHSVLESAAAAVPDYPALVCHGRVVRYAELLAQVDRVSGALERDGVSSGDAVLTLLPDGPAFVALAFATLRRGALLVPFDPELARDPDCTSLLEDAAQRFAPALCVVSAETWPAARQGLVSVGRSIGVARHTELPRIAAAIARLTSRGSSTPELVPWGTWLRDASPNRLESRGGAPTVSPGSPAVAFMSSAGLTPFTHEQLVAAESMLRYWVTDAIPGEETWLASAPLTTSFGFVSALGTALSLHSRLVLLPRATAQAVAEGVRFMRPDYGIGTAGQTTATAGAEGTASSPARSGGGAPRYPRHGGHPRVWIVAASTSRAADPDATRTSTSSSNLATRMGLSAPFAAGLLTCEPLNAPPRPGSIGVPLPGVDARVVDEQGNPQRIGATGATGALDLRAPNTMDPARWFRALHRVTIDRDGFIMPVATAEARGGGGAGMANQSSTVAFTSAIERNGGEAGALSKSDT